MMRPDFVALYRKCQTTYPREAAKWCRSSVKARSSNDERSTKLEIKKENLLGRWLHFV
jgi:hypothetical protein